MKKPKAGTSRRDFFRSGALATLPLMVPAAGLKTSFLSENLKAKE